MSRKLDSAPVAQNISSGLVIPRFGPTALRSINAGCMVIKIPINSTATSWIAPQVKWFLLRTLLSVVLKDKNAARRISTISISAGKVSVTSPRRWIPLTAPSAFWNAESPGSTPLRITATTIITRKIIL